MSYTKMRFEFLPVNILLGSFGFILGLCRVPVIQGRPGPCQVILEASECYQLHIRLRTQGGLGAVLGGEGTKDS